MKSNKGITLVALVITIIVLLILAGVSISLVVGDNGVLTQAQKASQKTDVASARSALEMTLTSVTSNFLGNVWEDNTSAKIYDSVKVSELDEELQNNGFYIVKFGGTTAAGENTVISGDKDTSSGDGHTAALVTTIIISEGEPGTSSHANSKGNTTYEAQLEWTDRSVKIKKQTDAAYDKDLKEGSVKVD